MAARVTTFFYGSFINRDVLAASDIRPERVRVARLDDWELRIRPLANVVPRLGDAVYGILAELDHAALSRLYGQAWVGVYHPHPVLVEAQDGTRVPALCYVAPTTEERPPERAYVERILGPAEEYGFPEPYLSRLRQLAAEAS